ncbi:hypothetical protein Salat_1646400 [Sesamum alatum]|uniref:Uncharacterized protein n=1 Tax=Sesamum alatum TaxID=300844 RepID=A0AAE1Y6L4_9LAMI|nr:hypothetical protein Salat_1646400 [Sesamum alatum]
MPILDSIDAAGAKSVEGRQTAEPREAKAGDFAQSEEPMMSRYPICQSGGDEERRMDDLQHLLSTEEDYCRQKAACKWVLQGERNMRFYHSLGDAYFRGLLTDGDAPEAAPRVAVCRTSS